MCKYLSAKRGYLNREKKEISFTLSLYHLNIGARLMWGLSNFSPKLWKGGETRIQHRQTKALMKRFSSKKALFLSSLLILLENMFGKTSCTRPKVCHTSPQCSCINLGKRKIFMQLWLAVCHNCEDHGLHTLRWLNTFAYLEAQSAFIQGAIAESNSQQ